MHCLFCLYRRNRHSFFIAIWNGSFFFRFFFRLGFHALVLKGIPRRFKSHLHRHFSSGGKIMSLTFDRNIRLLILILFPCCLHQLLADQHHQVLFVRCQIRDSFFYGFFCWKNRMMVGYFCIVNHSGDVMSQLSIIQERK